MRGKTAIVTGGAGGIGTAISRRLAADGANVLVADLHEPEDEAVAALRADVTREADVEQMIAEAERRFGRVDILVNNAGGFDDPVFPDAPVEHWTRTLDLNLRAPMLGIHFAVPAMQERGGGAIVNIASVAGLGLAPYPGPEYAVAKAGLMRLTACLAPLAERGIRVNCVCPYTVGTPAVRRDIAELTAQGRELPPPFRATLIEPEEIADAVVELVRDDTLAGRVMLCWGGEPRRLLPSEEPSSR